MKKSNKILLTFVIGIFVIIALYVMAGRLRATPVFPVSEMEMSSETMPRISNGAQHEYALGDFHAINIHGNGSVVIKKGEASKIILQGAASAIARVHFNVSEGVLDIELEKNPSFQPGESFLITVITAKDYDELNVGGAVALNLVDFASPILKMNFGGNSNCKASGKVDDLRLNIGGNVKVDAKNLLAKNVEVNVGGMGDVMVFASNSLHVNGFGMSKVVYFGNPKSVERHGMGIMRINAGE
jgi:hypothetical protein